MKGTSKKEKGIKTARASNKPSVWVSPVCTWWCNTMTLRCRSSKANKTKKNTPKPAWWMLSWENAQNKSIHLRNVGFCNSYWLIDWFCVHVHMQPLYCYSLKWVSWSFTVQRNLLLHHIVVFWECTDDEIESWIRTVSVFGMLKFWDVSVFVQLQRWFRLILPCFCRSREGSAEEELVLPLII